MKNFYIVLSVLVGAALVAGSAWAVSRTPVQVIPSGRVVVIPENAAEVAPHIFSLGTAVDPESGREVEGLMIVRYRRDYEKPPWAGGGKNGGRARNQCYAFLAKGAKWKSVEPWLVNAVNAEGLSDIFVRDNLMSDIAKWESFGSADILGDGSLTSAPLSADTDSPDGANEVYFGDIDSEGAIAVTVVWGYFSGPPKLRELVEWDQVYDQVDYDWSATGEPDKMDFENIATHEIGHAVGMGHPDDSCIEETMYRYAGFGETKKRTLEAGDKAGIAELY